MPVQFAIPPSYLTGWGGPASPPGLAQALSVNAAIPMWLTGRGPTIGATAATYYDVWGYPSTSGGTAQLTRVLPTAAITIAVVSDNVNDTSAGTGARTIGVLYLDTNWMPNYAVFTLNGQTAVTASTTTTAGFQPGAYAGGTITNAFRILRSEVLSAGTGNANAGNIFVTNSTGQTYTLGVPQTANLVQDCILIGDNVSSTAAFTIPAGYYGMIVQLTPACADQTTTVKYGKVRIGTTYGPNNIFQWFDIGGLTSQCNPDSLLPTFMPWLQPKSDLNIQASATAATEICCYNALLIWPTYVNV